MDFFECFGLYTLVLMTDLTHIIQKFAFMDVDNLSELYIDYLMVVSGQATATGSVIYERQFGAEGNQCGNDIVESSTSYFIAGFSSVADDSDILLIKQPK
jgi:hypothetical protein